MNSLMREIYCQQSVSMGYMMDEIVAMMSEGENIV